MAIPKSVELKLGRAEEHIGTLDAEIQAYFVNEPYSAYRLVENGGTDHVILWSQCSPPPERFGLIAGDAIHNVRSSLDHMAVALARSGAAALDANVSEEEERRLQFPITMSAEEFQTQVTRGALKWVPDKAVAVIESRQPFNALPKNPRLFPLYEISQFDNADKHRELTVALLSTSIVRVSWPNEVADAPMQTPGIHLKFEPHTEIARFIFPRPMNETEVPLDYRWGFTLAGAAPGMHDIRHTLKAYLNVARFTALQLSDFVQGL